MHCCWWSEHPLCTGLKSIGQATSDPGNSNAVGLLPFRGEQRGEPLVANCSGNSQVSSERHDEGCEGAMLNFPNSLFIGSFLDVLMFSVTDGERLYV